MATVRIILHKSRPIGDEYPVYLRITDSTGKRIHLPTGLFAKKEDFDESKEGGRFRQGKGVQSYKIRKVTNGTTEYITNAAANIELETKRKRATKLIDGYQEQGTDWTLERFRNEFEKQPGRTLFIDYVEKRLEILRKGGQIQSEQILHYTLVSMKKYDSKLGEKYLQDITPEYIKQYVKRCEKDGMATNTISIRLRQIRRLFSLAKEEGLTEAYPFESKALEKKGVSIPNGGHTKVESYLPKESLKKIASVDLENPRLDTARHLFLFSTYCYGMNWKDMAQLTTENIKSATNEVTEEEGKVISYYRQKTKTTKREASTIDIWVTPVIQQELDWFERNTKTVKEYLLPIITDFSYVTGEEFQHIKKGESARKFEAEKIAQIQAGNISLEELNDELLNGYVNQRRKRFNKAIRDVAGKAGVPESQVEGLTIYSARHSFAMALQNKGVSVEKISQALGHESIETTKAYLDRFSVGQMAVDTAIDLMDAEEDVAQVAPEQAEEKKPETTPSTADRLLKLADLMEKGLITAEEFKTLKNSIIAGE